MGKISVQTVVSGKEDQVGAFPLGLPDGFCRFHLKDLGGFILGQNNTVTAGRVNWAATTKNRTLPPSLPVKTSRKSFGPSPYPIFSTWDVRHSGSFKNLASKASVI